MLAKRYNHMLKNLPLQLPAVEPQNRSSFHLYVVRLKPSKDFGAHRRVLEELRQHGIGVNLHYMPVHLQPYYRRLGFRQGQYPEAEAYGAQAITLPLYPELTDPEQDWVGDVLGKLL